MTEARLIGLLLVGTVKLLVLAVRALWWLAMRHAWALLALTVVAVNLGYLPSPLVDERMHGAFSVLFVWAGLGLAWPPTHRAFKAHRARRVARAAGHQLERPAVQRWITARVPGGDRAQAGTAEALRLWARWNRTKRQLRRDLADVNGGRMPKAMRQQWEQILRSQEATR